MYLRRVTTQDLPLLIEWAQDERYDEFFRRTPPLCDWNHPNLVESTFSNYYIIMKNGKELGLASMGVEDPFSKSFKVGGMMIHNHTMQESKELMDHMLDIGFNQLLMNRVTTVVLAHRVKLQERLTNYGFRLEGIFKESALYRGKLTDERLYAIRRNEWVVS